MNTTNAYKQNRPVDAFTTSSINWKKNCVESWKTILEQKLKTGKKKELCYLEKQIKSLLNIHVFRMAVYLWNAGQKVNLPYSLSDRQNVGLQLLLPIRNFNASS